MNERNERTKDGNESVNIGGCYSMNKVVLLTFDKEKITNKGEKCSPLPKMNGWFPRVWKWDSFATKRL